MRVMMEVMILMTMAMTITRGYFSGKVGTRMCDRERYPFSPLRFSDRLFFSSFFLMV